MPRSFLVKKKGLGMSPPRPVGACSPGAGPASPVGLYPCTATTTLPTTHVAHHTGISIFSPAKLCSSPMRSDPEPTPPVSPLSPSGHSHGSITPEPINYSLSASPSSTASCPVTPTSSARASPASSPEPEGVVHPAWSPEMHLPFLALSFKRLQEMHLKAVETRLQGISMSPPHHSHPVAPALSPFGRTSPVAMSPPLSHHHHQHHQQTTSPKMSPVPDARRELSLSPSMPRPCEVPHLPTYSWVSHQNQNQQQQQQEGCYPVAMDTGDKVETPRKRKDNDPPRYQCEACNKSYATFSGLSKHKQFHCTALIKKEFVCKHCDKKYVSLGALKMHIRTHTLPCKCHICGKAFSRPWLLQGHVRTHTGEKPFPCDHCGRSFADRSNLRAHLQTHTDIKKYNCRSCSKSFSRSSLLHKHMDNGCGGASVRAL